MGTYEELVFVADALRQNVHDIEFILSDPAIGHVEYEDGDIFEVANKGIEIVDGRVRVHVRLPED